MDPPASLHGVPLRERRIPVQGITLRVVEAGPREGPLVLLLHGFPEFWYGWRKQIPAVARAGYRVWAPDQRGYGGSDKPREVEEYRVEALALDVVELIRAAGVERAAAVVGHDFTRADRVRYREAWSVPGAITGMVNWYRAMLRHPPRAPGSTRVEVPTLILWGERDRYLTSELAPLSLARCDHGRLITFPDATHWLQHDEPQAVNQAVLEFLRGDPEGAR